MRLRVLSLNVWGLPPPVGQDLAERFARIASGLGELDADLVLLQEVWTESGRAQFADAGRRLGLEHVWWADGAARRSSGLVVLSRFPILRSSYRPFALCGLPERITQMDYYAGKGIGRIEIAPQGQPVVVLATHLHARYAPPHVQDDFIGHRAAQVIEIAEELQGIEAPVVLAGDLNMRESAPEYRLLMDLTGLRDAAAVVDARQATVLRANAYRERREATSEARIDYVMLRDGHARGLATRSVSRVFDGPIEIAGRPAAYSDHAGVLAELEAVGAGRAAAEVPASAWALGHRLLAGGRARASTRRRRQRLAAGAGLGAAVAAAASARSHLSRRAFLRWTLGAGAGAAAAGSAGLLVLSERFVPVELDAFDDAARRLERLREAKASAPLPGAVSLR